MCLEVESAYQKSLWLKSLLKKSLNECIIDEWAWLTVYAFTVLCENWFVSYDFN